MLFGLQSRSAVHRSRPLSASPGPGVYKQSSPSQTKHGQCKHTMPRNITHSNDKPKLMPFVCVFQVLEKLSGLLLLPFALDEQPHTLDDMTLPSVPLADHSLSSSLPQEDDEMKPKLPEQSEPRECSQSEVTFLGMKERGTCLTSRSAMTRRREDTAVSCLQTDCGPALDLYSSWPVECSCAAGAETGCEDCWANGFSHSPSFIPQGM